MSATGTDWTLYRHRLDESVLYEVRSTEPSQNHGSEGPEYIEQYEVRRVDNPEIFGGEPFIAEADEFEQIYEPVPSEQQEDA